ncbi:class I SAM-dependent DNA methyltransferase [Peribacillus sp. SCS-155]|uniref:class I SAM-dependent DNA methyltransferase n=1 Tax=Peribacillus sedimenti TaxID=3115297 RepID=UPI0039060BED
MTYEQFAYVYDFLMKDAPYDKWLYFLTSRMGKYGLKQKSVLDLACGTGEFTIKAAQKGYSVSGVDLSEEMLTIASEKAANAGIHIPLYHQNMAELEGLGLYECVTIFCDSLNYLKHPEDVERTFERVHAHLEHGGLFMFDVHSEFKIQNIFLNQTFALSDEEVSYIWESFPGTEALSVEHELSFFVLNPENGSYDRIDELHYQRTYPVNQYTEWLKDAGFEVLEVLSDLGEQPVQQGTERVLFIARKK